MPNLPVQGLNDNIIDNCNNNIYTGYSGSTFIYFPVNPSPFYQINHI